MSADHDFAVSIENYLKMIWHLEQKNFASVSNRELAETLQVKKPSVSQMVQKLEGMGLVKRDSLARRSGYRLSAKGQKRALKLLRAHRLVEMFLQKSLGLEGVFLHQEAERLEHAVSDRLISEIDRFLGYPDVDFAGAPIPRPEQGAEYAAGFSDKRNQKSLLCKARPGKYTIVRIHDDSSKLLELLDSRGVSVGSKIEVLGEDAGRLKIRRNKLKFEISMQDAASLEVATV